MRSKVLIVGAAALIAMTSNAFADHGKAGLWQVTTKMDMPGMSARAFTTQHCMTPTEVKQNAMPPSSNSACKMVDVKNMGRSFSANMVCNGQAKGTGHIQVIYDADTHYAGQMTMNMSAGGQMMNMTNSFEGKWISADCGKAAH